MIDTNNIIAQNILYLLIKKDKKQTELAAYIGVDEQSVHTMLTDC
jgi:DNA-binding Xre family transcriptional regulator